MSKTTASTDSTSTKGTKKGALPISQIRNGGKKVLMFLGIVAVIALMFVPIVGKAIGAKLGALYLFGDNGKKSGRTGGNVYQRNGRVREFKVPALVRNTYTSFVRSVFATYSSAFRALHPEQIIEWNNYKGYSSDRFGRMVEIKGKQAFIRLNGNLANSTQSPINDPPVSGIPPLATLLAPPTIKVSGSVFDLPFTPNPTGVFTEIFATASLSAGVSRPANSKFRMITVIDTSGVSPADLWAAYVAKFGVPTVGANIFVRAKVIGDSTGLASAITAEYSVANP